MSGGRHGRLVHTAAALAALLFRDDLTRVYVAVRSVINVIFVTTGLTA